MKNKFRRQSKEFTGVEVGIDDKGINGSFERMIKKFKRKVVKERVIYEFKEHQEYKKPSQKRHYRDFVVRCRQKYGKRKVEKADKIDITE